MDKEFSWNAQQANPFTDNQEAAELARWMELENEFASRTRNPEMKMAAMLAMAGQPGALQQMLFGRAGSKDSAQQEMDALESSIANDMFALASADRDTYSKLTGALIPLYRSKFEELLAKGAKSRMGGDWATGWGTHFDTLNTTRKKRKAQAQKQQSAAAGKYPDEEE